jgi:3-oxoadipate enol-lactonase
MLAPVMPYAIGRRGIRIHYEIHGHEGPWVVMLMGLGASARLWLDYPARLIAGARPYRILTIDNRGTGQSDVPRGPIWMRDMADDAVAVMDAAGAARAFVVGASMGGMIAQHVALRHPARALGLVLVSTTPGLPHGALPTVRALRALLAYGLGHSSDSDVLADLLLAPSQRHRAAEVHALLSPIFASDGTSRGAFLGQLIGCMLHSTARRLHRIAVPTIVVTGAEDILIRPHCSRILAARIPGAELEVVAGAGHGAPFTDPEVIPRALARLGDAQPVR